MSAKLLLEKVGLTPAQKKTLRTVRTRRIELGRLHEEVRPDRMSDFGPLHREMDEAQVAMFENPSRETIDAYHSARIRCDSAAQSWDGVSPVFEHALNQLHEPLKPIVADVFDRARKMIDEHRQQALATLNDDNVIESEAELAASAGRRLAELDHVRPDGDLMGWMDRFFPEDD